MFDFEKTYLPKHEQLKKLILKKDSFYEALSLALELHSYVHMPEVHESDQPTYENDIWEAIPDDKFCLMPSKKDFSPAWNIWHITRIEDLVSNLLMAESEQVYNSDRQIRLNNTVTDTGNAMTWQGVAEFSAMINIDALKDYRNAVGKRTVEVLKGLQAGDFRKKPTEFALQRILQVGGLTNEKGSFWLLDFWGKKTFGGLTLLPLTRHHTMHFASCLKLAPVLANL